MLYDNDLKQEMTTRYKESQTLFQQFWYQADLDLKTVIGQQDFANQFLNVNYRNQRLLQFNKTLRLINMVSGYQRKNRHVSIAIPREDSDQKTADQLTGLMMWAMEQDGTYEKISDSFEGGIITGLNLLNVWMDFRDDPENGDIRTRRVHHNQFIMDPYWREHDLSDCEWIWQRKYLSKEQIKSIMPENLSKEIENLKQAPQSVDGRFLFMPENRQMYNMKFYSYDEYWTRIYKEIYKLFDNQTGEVVDVPKDMDEQKLKVFMKLHPSISKIKVKKPTVKLHILVNDNLIYEEEAPYGIDKYPFVPFICYHYPEVQDYSFRYEGLIRNVRDSQIELNRRRNKMLDLIDSQINSGLIAKEDALVNPEDAFLTGQGRVLFLKENAQITDVQKIQPAQVPQSMFEMQSLLDQEIMSIAGVSEELFGESDGKDTSGFMTQLRMGAGLVSLQNIFDRLRSSQKRLGELYIDLIQANFSSGKVRRILNQEPTEEFKNQSFQKYDCIVEEGMLTSSQKQLQFIQLLNLKQMGIAVPAEILLEASTFQNKDDLIKAVKSAEEQQSKMAMAQQKLEMEHQALLTRSVEAKAQNDFASAQERQGRTIADLGLYVERESEKTQNMAQAALDNARAIKELAGLDDERLIKLTTFLMQMQKLQQETSQGTEIKGIQSSEFIGPEVDMAKKDTELPQIKEKKMQEVSQAINATQTSGIQKNDEM